jgi:hypothetical protein
MCFMNESTCPESAQSRLGVTSSGMAPPERDRTIHSAVHETLLESLPYRLTYTLGEVPPMKARLLALAILISVALVGTVAAQQSSDNSTTKKKTDVEMQKKPVPSVQTPAGAQAPSARRAAPVVNPAQTAASRGRAENNIGGSQPSSPSPRPESSGSQEKPPSSGSDKGTSGSGKDTGAGTPTGSHDMDPVSVGFTQPPPSPDPERSRPSSQQMRR